MMAVTMPGEERTCCDLGSLKDSDRKGGERWGKRESRHLKFVLGFSIVFIAGVAVKAQNPMQYEATIESLDRHPLPDWYADAKLGIFIHWGLYSVPAGRR